MPCHANIRNAGTREFDRTLEQMEIPWRPEKRSTFLPKGQNVTTPNLIGEGPWHLFIVGGPSTVQPSERLFRSPRINPPPSRTSERCILHRKYPPQQKPRHSIATRDTFSTQACDIPASFHFPEHSRSLQLAGRRILRCSETGRLRTHCRERQGSVLCHIRGRRLG
jgi:hypothetical protein